MEAGKSCAAVARLKRENYSRTKHDPAFSEWRVLIGPSDWEEYSQRKEGAARYRVHNLPTRSGPGVYELGIGVSRSGLGHEAGKLDPNGIVVVYLGQADNVRTRLQRYGRSGSHLGNGCSTDHCSDSKAETLKGLGLFEEIFSRGHSILFRWAPMKDKSDALETEAQLLNTFDYGWNKGGNGARRPGDILQKLRKTSSIATWYPNIPRRIQLFRQGGVGIKIKASETCPPDKSGDEQSKSFLPGIFNFGRSRPRLVSNTHNHDLIQICGFIMRDGIPCRTPPVPGRKRCQEHKGKQIYAFSSKSSAEGTSHDVDDAYLGSRLSSGQNGLSHYTVCGINLGDGTLCGKQALMGRKRCEEHKGMRIKRITSKPSAEYNFHEPAVSSVFNTYDDRRTGNASSEIDIQRTSQHQSSHKSFHGEHSIPNICGATLRNGSSCSRQPIQGNKRCWQHKGQRIDNILSGMNNSMARCDVLTCGAALQNGSVCQRTPVHGRKRCEQHKGMRIATSRS